MRTIYLHDTRTGEVARWSRAVAGRVGIYACGPTVYGRIHVGNARPFVVFSQLKRFLVHEGYDVTFVANVTDVNDKIYDAARAQGVGSEELAREMTAHYVADTDALGLGRPDHEPLASETIGPIVSLIERLVDDSHAYAVDGDVYFSVRSYPKYGEISHRDVDQMDQGEALEGAGRKRDPRDFALWKGLKEGEDTAWDSPWGRGRPGWHIECSAMAEQELGLGFEIHGGGSDLLFPHHENEAAQTFAARGEPLAQLWMHNGMVRLESEKMSKSIGNVFVLHKALERFGRDSLLMYFCGAHYRQPIEFDDERLEEAEARCARIREAARRLTDGPVAGVVGGPARARSSPRCAADFNTAARAGGGVRLGARGQPRRAEAVGNADLRAMLDVFGLANLARAAQAGRPPRSSPCSSAPARRARARDFARADELRDQLRELGWEVRDGPDGAELVPL